MRPHYDSVSKILHWLIFILLTIEFVVAWTMPGGRGMTEPTALVSFHFSLGLLILCIMLIRAVWVATHRPPPQSDAMARYANLLARLLHFTFYGIIVVLPFLGWAWAGARGWTVMFFGLFNLPPLVATGSALGKSLGNMHSLLAGILVGLVGLHFVATLYHHFILKDDTLTRILPSVKKQD